MILAARTDNPTAELYLLSAKGDELARDVWVSDRELSVQLHQHIDDLLRSQGSDYTELKGLIAYEGPGSFTGLRIGITVLNAMAYGLSLPIVASGGDNWLRDGVDKLVDSKPGGQVLPRYGGEANVTAPRK